MAADGKRGEDYAAMLLEEAGYRILARNFSTRRGEIDIIAQQGDIIAFVEVKTRAFPGLYPPAAAVDACKQRRILRAAAEYLVQNPLDLQPRFDVFEIIAARGPDFRALAAEHLEGAFGVDETNRPD
jgi:putative endonuclease